MLRIIVVALAVALASLPSPRAQEAQRPQGEPSVAAEVAREVVTQEIWKRTLAGVAKQNAERFRTMAEQKGGTVDDGLEPAIRKVYEDLIPYDQLVSIQANVLAKGFTSQELAQLRDFYRSPLGVKVRDRMPEMVQEALVTALKGAQPQQAKIDALLTPHFHIPQGKQAAKPKKEPGAAASSSP